MAAGSSKTREGIVVQFPGETCGVCGLYNRSEFPSQKNYNGELRLFAHRGAMACFCQSCAEHEGLVWGDGKKFKMVWREGAHMIRE